MAKTVFVTGSSKVTGKNIALEFARAGYDVGVTYASNEDGAIDAVNQIKAMGQNARHYHLDTRDVEGCRKTIAEFADEFGGIDVFVNNTGLTRMRPFFDITMEAFLELWETNFRGMYFCGQAAARDMVKRGTKGSIINLSSLHLRGTWPGDTMYAVCKRAIQKLTECEAYDLAEYGIRVNCIAPGYIDTGWGMRPGGADRRAVVNSRIPLHRFAEGWEIGKAAVFLASEDAEYITGETLLIDGGALLPVVQENYYLPQVDYYPKPIFMPDKQKF